ncbi:MAG: hypothetical protein K0R92_785 [Lachnospiraceae bacterium]|jgi:hypothetical protein|nr:hypothetical protein [Lachnospiraceae bacterium]
MITVDSAFVEFAERQVAENVKYYANEVSDNRATEIAKDIVKLIDWNNSALLHKGLSWIAQNYLKLNCII